MKFTHASILLAALVRPCLSVAVDMWSSPLIKERAVPDYKSIEPEEIKARLGKTFEEYQPEGTDKRRPGMVYFCKEENWGAPCYVLYPELHYTCSELPPILSKHVGSVYLEPGALCRMATLDTTDGTERCDPFEFFAWEETKYGWANTLNATVGEKMTHFTCTRCDNCPDGGLA